MSNKNYIYIYEVHAIEKGSIYTIARFTNAKQAIKWLERFKEKWEETWIDKQKIYRKPPF